MGAPWPGAGDEEILIPRRPGLEITDADRSYWAFQPIRRPDVPDDSSTKWDDQPIDGFVFSRLAAKKLLPSSPASKRQLARRLYFDLIGLPPTYEVVEKFVSDPSPQAIEIETRRRQVTKATLLGSKRKFRQYGESGLWGSDSFPHINEHLDDICVLRSLYADTFAHASALIQLNSGRVVQGSPTLGSWLGYGLGSQTDNLPGYVVMLDPRGGPIAGAANWSSGFMPAAYQGTHLRNKGEPILDLSPRDGVTRKMQRDLIDTLGDLNAKHLTQRPGYSELPARIASYELAYQLQMTAPEAMDISQESRETQEMYGLFDPTPKENQSVGPKPFGTQCLVARRLIERGVRYIQIYSGGGHGDQNWDAHGDVEKNLRIHAPEIDRPIAGLLTDLKQRGLLDDTLIVWGGEFGRQSVSQPGNANGRDHNPLGFTYWMAGGGVKDGMTYGETDELGHQAVVDRRHIRDLHATILHQMGLDHRKLTYFYGGLDHKLTGVHPAEVISDVIA